MPNPANTSGNDLEARVREVIRQCKIRPYKHHRIGTFGVFGEEMESDVLISSNKAFPLGLIIQCKAQNSVGSAHLKLYYLHDSIKHHYPRPAVIVCDGTSKEIKAACDWLKQHVGGMLWGVFWFDEFAEWFAKKAEECPDEWE